MRRRKTYSRYVLNIHTRQSRYAHVLYLIALVVTYYFFVLCNISVFQPLKLVYDVLFITLKKQVSGVTSTSKK